MVRVQGQSVDIAPAHVSARGAAFLCVARVIASRAKGSAIRWFERQPWMCSPGLDVVDPGASWSLHVAPAVHAAPVVAIQDGQPEGGPFTRGREAIHVRILSWVLASGGHGRPLQLVPILNMLGVEQRPCRRGVDATNARNWRQAEFSGQSESFSANFQTKTCNPPWAWPSG